MRVGPHLCKKPGTQEPADHPIGKSRGGMTREIHLAADTVFFQAVLECWRPIQFRRHPRQARTHPRRVLEDKAYTSKANRDNLTARGSKVTIPERGPEEELGLTRT